MVAYKQIIPATDWFYVDSAVNNDVIIYHVAAWGLTEENLVIGLVSAQGAQNGECMCAKLITVPPSNTGMYKHKNELGEREMKKLENERFQSRAKSLV